MERNGGVQAFVRQDNDVQWYSLESTTNVDAWIRSTVAVNLGDKQ